jgi:probable HAF family extracellular repeat protein
MKSARLMCITATALLVVLAFPVSLAAQEHPTKHHQYNLVDIGTFGGPNVQFNFSSPTDHLLGSNGKVTGGADTATVDPLCFDSPDCFVEHAFKWQKGVLNDLGALPGGTGNNSSQAFWINDRGQTVGLSTNGTVEPLTGHLVLHAVLWSDREKIKDLGTFGGYDSYAAAINRREQVVGLAANATPDPNALFLLGQQVRAFLWDAKTGMQDLGTLGTGNDAFATYVNDRGQVAGYAYTNTTPNPADFLCGQLQFGLGVPTVDPFFWENGTMTDIGTLGGVCSYATGLNNRGQVIGDSDLAGDIIFHPFRWDKKGGLQDLGLLGGVYGATWGINDAGDAVGWADLAGDVINHAVLWPNGTTTPIDLGVTGGFTMSVAVAINSRGQIIGCVTSDPNSACFPNGDAFLWENGDMVDLNSLVPPHPGIQLTGGDVYINDQGEIVIPGILSDGDVHAFLLTPCDDNHRDGGNCEERAEGATSAAQSSSALVTRSLTKMTEGTSSTNDRIGGARGRLGRRYPYRGFETHQEEK